MTNSQIAARLEEVADLLELDPKANRFRLAAYRDAAATLRRLETPATEILRGEGPEGLDALPGIGEGLARSIQELAETGHLGLLDRLREQADPEAVFATLPGLGPALAARVHRQLGVDTLPELEQAATAGRLRQVRGIGSEIERHIVEVLQARLRRRQVPGPVPGVEELLSVDEEYRQKALAGELRKIAPKRFNPAEKAWLPVLHTHRGPRRYTALFSNTALAHQLDRTRDWVVLFHALPGQEEQRVTVVTETHGPLRGRRVVRGREKECADYYEAEGC